MRRAAAVLAVLMLAVTGCTGVPTSSAPETIEPLDTGAQSNVPTVEPVPGADPRNLVSQFLAVNANDANEPSSARLFLTAQARSHWSDATATIVSDESVGTYDALHRTLTVKGVVLGTLNAEGIYTPSLGGSTATVFSYTLAQVGGEYRIDGLRNGLLLTEEQFQSTYQQRVLYFYDVAESHLVPDLRWSALVDRSQLANWLLGQLVNGPRPELQNAVSTDTFPAQVDARHVTAVLGTPTKVQIPGSGQLDAGTRDRLAEQVSQTLLETVSGRALTILDGGSPVVIPKIGSEQFTASDFATPAGPVAPSLYYVSNGRVVGEAGKPLSGPLGNGSDSVQSIAVGQARPGAPVLFAGVEGSGDAARLAVGTQSAGLQPTSVRGRLSRPAFAPRRAEVWVAAGPALYQVSVTGTQSKVARVQLPSVSGGGPILAVRFSPEGSRIALVVAGAGGSTQLYIGSVVRSAGQVRVDAPQEISPPGVVVRDVAWLDSLKLFAIGYLSGSEEARTFETGVDGTEWTNSGIGNLPPPLDSVTGATAANVWVSANGYVWKQNGTQWVSPGPTGQTPGTAPAYLE